MFGIMKPAGCGSTAEIKTHHRSHYCGTCKTMGVTYGQASRMTLNYDAVFLGEILSSLSGENMFEWEEKLKSSNCVSMPKNKAGIPKSLQYAAAANIMLGSLKVDDHIHDSKSIFWKVGRRLFNNTFSKAEKQLNAMGCDTTKLWGLAHQQRILEAKYKNEVNDAILDEAALPTAKMTEEVFAKGALFCGCSGQATLMGELGFAFGKYAYLADALEDFDEDIRRGEFNALALIYDDKSQAREAVSKRLFELVRSVKAVFQELPLSMAQKATYSSRIQSSLMLSLYDERQAHSCSTSRTETIKQRWENASNTAALYMGKVQGGLARMNHATASFVIFLNPETPNYLEPAKTNPQASTSIWAILAAFIASLAAGLHLRKRKMPPAPPKTNNAKGIDCCDGCDCGGCEGCCDGCGKCDGCGNCCDGCDCNGCNNCCSGCGRTGSEGECCANCGQCCTDVSCAVCFNEACGNNCCGHLCDKSPEGRRNRFGLFLLLVVMAIGAAVILLL